MNKFTESEVLVPRGHPLPDFTEHGVEVSHFFVGTNYAKIFEIPAGKVIGYHRHTRYHAGTLLTGQAMVTINGISFVQNAPHSFDIPAGVSHCVEAMTDTLWACLWENPEGHTSPEAFDHTVIA